MSTRPPHRPSSRRALTRALQLARDAVQLDSANEDPQAAVQAYARSVTLLNEVMERVRRGEDSTESRRSHRRRSVAAQEEEVRRLQNIHDTYADRMNILSIIYSIPPVPYSSNNSLLFDDSLSQHPYALAPRPRAFSSSSNDPFSPPAAAVVDLHLSYRLSRLPSLSEEPRLNDTRDDDDLHTPRNKRAAHPLPPIPDSSSPGDASNTPRTSLHLAEPPLSPRGPRKPIRLDVLAPPAPIIINSTTSYGTISQRRMKPSPPFYPVSPIDSPQQSPPPPPPPPHSGRIRSSSQPGRRPSISNNSIDLPPPPPLPSSLGSRRPFKLPSNWIQTPDTNSPSIPSLTPPSTLIGALPFVPASIFPHPQPTDPLRKPYYLMGLLAASMSSPTGSYITRRLHVPNEVWSIGGVKLPNVPEKIRALEILLAALTELQMASSEVFGAGNVSSGMAMGIGSVGPKEANAWVLKLEDFSNVCDNVVNDFGKKIGVGEGFVPKKTTWGDKLSRRFEKFANGKNIDSPTAYMNTLRKMFQDVQLLDEHTKAVFSQPIAPAYAAFPIEFRVLAEQKLKRASEFFTSVVLAFVIRDLALLLDKYVKKCEKVLED